MLWGMDVWAVDLGWIGRVSYGRDMHKPWLSTRI